MIPNSGHALSGIAHWVRRNPAKLAFALGALLFLILQYRLLAYRVWNDEAETVVTANMMAAGSRLYAGIFNHHGPMTFFTGYFVALSGHGTLIANRLLIALLQWALILLILRTAPPGRYGRLLLFLVIVTLLTGPLRDAFAHMYKYQVLAGMCSAAAIALFVLPRLRGEPSSRAGSAAAGFFLGIIPFLAFTYIPAVVALVVVGVSRDTWRPLALGGATAALLSLAFLALTGSLTGYAAYHFYLNLAVLPAYSRETTNLAAMLNEWRYGESRIIGLGAVVLAAIALWRLRADRGTSWWRLALFGLALLSYAARGNGFHALPLYYSLLALSQIFVGPAERCFAARPLIGWAVVALLTIKLSGLLPGDVAAFRKYRIDYDTPFALLVKANSTADDRVIAYSFRNFDYLAAERLPASKDFFYLPWQLDYNRRPVFGIRNDTCAEIAANRPKFVELDKWKVYQRISWESYGGCIDRLIARDYRLLPGTIVYARKDIEVDPALVHRAAALTNR